MSAKQILLITGGNTGLGYEAVRALCRSSTPYQILLGGRSIQKAEDAVKKAKAEYPQTASSLETIRVDVEDDASIENAFKEVSSRHGHLDILVNNAGAGFDHKIQDGSMTMREAWNKAWDINVSGTQVMTHTFVPLLLKSSNPRLLFITSGTSPLAETEDPNWFLNKSPEAGWPKPPGRLITSYRSSKTGMNMMMREWARILKNDHVKVFAVSPGYLATGLGGGVAQNKAAGAEDPQLGGEFIKDIVEGKRDADAGKAIRRDNKIQPW